MFGKHRDQCARDVPDADKDHGRVLNKAIVADIELHDVGIGLAVSNQECFGCGRGVMTHARVQGEQTEHAEGCHVGEEPKGVRYWQVTRGRRDLLEKECARGRVLFVPQPAGERGFHAIESSEKLGTDPYIFWFPDTAGRMEIVIVDCDIVKKTSGFGRRFGNAWDDGRRGRAREEGMAQNVKVEVNKVSLVIHMWNARRREGWWSLNILVKYAGRC